MFISRFRHHQSPEGSRMRFEPRPFRPNVQAASVPRVIQRLTVDGQVIEDVQTVGSETAKEYLDRWAKADANFEATPDEVLELTIKHIQAIHKSGRAWVAAERDLGDYAEQLAGFAAGGPYAEKANEVRRIRERAAEELAAVPYQGYRLHIAQRQSAQLEQTVVKASNIKVEILRKALGQIRRIGASFGLPALDADTVRDFSTLEEHKERARQVRRPLDELLVQFVRPLQRIIPGAKLLYRGSLTRGVKSPSKYADQAAGPALAEFDAPKVKKAETRTSYATETGQVSFDCDANIEVPDKAMQALQLVSGPLTKNNQENGVVQELIGLQRAIAQEVAKLDIEGFETQGFELYINSASKAGAQLGTGTPYPSFLLENAGLTGLAQSSPKAFSSELVNKVLEYAPNMKYKRYLLPLTYWEPYFANLYQQIKTKGPEAAFLPEVQVEIGDRVREHTAIPEPRDTTDITGPTDLLARETWIGPATAARDVVAGAVFRGKVTKIIQPRERTKSPFAVISLGAGQEALCFNRLDVLQPGKFLIFEVIRTDGKSPVVTTPGW